jgi:hypothetical protein
MAPYLAVGAIGEAQSAAGQSEDAKYSKQLQSLAAPSLAESQTLAGDYNAGVISPTNQKVVNTMESQGAAEVASASGLSAIAQAAFTQYQNGTLQPAQQAQLDAQTAAQKQQVAQQLASAGITDSTILAAQYQNIDNNALIQKQTILNSNFATGTAAYDQWLTATTQGQQTIQNGMEYASTALNTELTNSMSEATIGIPEMTQAITTQMQTDQEYAAQVSTLMGTLATAYAKQVAGQRSGTTTGGTSLANPLGSSSGGGGLNSASQADNATAGGNPQNLGGATETAAPGSDLTYDSMGNITGSTVVPSYASPIAGGGDDSSLSSILGSSGGDNSAYSDVFSGL